MLNRKHIPAKNLARCKALTASNYDQLDAEIRAELPLKRIWTLALQEEES